MCYLPVLPYLFVDNTNNFPVWLELKINNRGKNYDEQLLAMSQFKGVDRLSEYQQLVNTVTDPWQ